MAKNCLVTQLKGEVSLENPDYFGYALIHISNNTDAVRGVAAFAGESFSKYFPVGSRIIGEGTFSTGKKIVEEGDNALIPANTSMDVLVPKYTSFVMGVGLPSDGGDRNNSTAAIDIDDFSYAFSSGNVTNINKEYGLNFSITPDGYKSKGNLEIVIQHCVDGSVDAFGTINSDVSLNLNETSLITKCTILSPLVFIGAKNVTGSLETFFSRFAQANKSAALAESGTKRIAIYNSGITSRYFNNQLDASIIAAFNASNVVTLTQSGRSVTYNIETDTWAE